MSNIISGYQFQLSKPVINSKSLIDSSASFCLDCYAHTSGLDPLRSLQEEALGYSGTVSLYRNNSDFIAFDSLVSVVPGPVIQDTYQRVFLTRDDAGGLLQVTEGGFSSDLSSARVLSDLATPVAAPSVELITLDTGVWVSSPEIVAEKYAAFVVTFVTDRGEETAPSPASEVVGYIDSDDYGFRLTDLPVSTYPHVTARRIYITVDGEYYLIAEIAAAGASHDLASLDDDAISDLITTTDFSPPLADLRGLVGLPGGALAGFVNDGDTGTVCVSEPFLPHAWPVGYRFKTYDKVVALAPVPEGLLVLTVGKPMIIVGDSPDVMSAHVIESTESCVSARSVLVSNGVCYWASPDGIAAFGGSQIQVVSRGTWSREQWQALDPRSMLFAWYEAHLLIYSDVGGWLFSLSRQDVSELSESGDHLQAVWRSKSYVIPRAGVLSTGRLEADDYPVQLLLSAEGEAVMDKQVSGNQLFRLASKGRKRELTYEIRTNFRVSLVQLAGSAEEIA